MEQGAGGGQKHVVFRSLGWWHCSVEVWRCWQRSAGMQSLLQGSSLYLLAGPGQVLLDESMQWDQPVSTERVGLPEGELHSQGGDLSVSYVVKQLGSSKTNMYNPKNIFPVCCSYLLRNCSWDWVWVRKWSCAWFLFSPTPQSIFKKWEPRHWMYSCLCKSLKPFSKSWRWREGELGAKLPLAGAGGCGEFTPHSAAHLRNAFPAKLKQDFSLEKEML